MNNNISSIPVPEVEATLYLCCETLLVTKSVTASFSKSVFSINYQELSDENKLTNPTVFECIE